MVDVLEAATTTRRRQPSRKRLAATANAAARQNFIHNLTEMHALAHHIGLHATGHALHKAVQIVGYEVAGHLDAYLKNRDGTA